MPRGLEGDVTQEQLKTVGDVLSIGTIVATLLSWLPHIAALLGVVWWCIRISETKRFEQFITWIRRKF
jgi:hypothetical protein